MDRREWTNGVDSDERRRSADRSRRIELARRARCERDGCHPVCERISRTVLLLAVRFHRWATPPARRRSPTPTTPPTIGNPSRLDLIT